MIKILAIVGVSFLVLVWLIRRNYKPSELEQSFALDAEMQRLSYYANASQVGAMIPLSSYNTGWGTTMRLNTTNPLSPNNTPKNPTFNNIFPTMFV